MNKATHSYSSSHPMYHSFEQGTASQLLNAWGKPSESVNAYS